MTEESDMISKEIQSLSAQMTVIGQKMDVSSDHLGAMRRKLEVLSRLREDAIVERLVYDVSIRTTVAEEISRAREEIDAAEARISSLGNILADCERQIATKRKILDKFKRDG